MRGNTMFFTVHASPEFSTGYPTILICSTEGFGSVSDYLRDAADIQRYNIGPIIVHDSYRVALNFIRRSPSNSRYTELTRSDAAATRAFYVPEMVNTFVRFE